uniref:ATPase, T2SS/T4P/T4SS family n=1 Tax=Orrella sp. TaxID=1921583 RepID=UPI0040484DED
MLDVDMIFEDGRKQTLTVDLPSLIGKDPSSQIHIDYWRVGKTHAKITRTGDFLQIQDLGSFIGTRINGASKSYHYPLLPTDEVIIGPCRLRFKHSNPSLTASIERTQNQDDDDRAEFVAPLIDPVLRTALHAELIELFDLRKVDLSNLSNELLKERARALLSEMFERDDRGLSESQRAVLSSAVIDDVAGLGVLQALMEDTTISEIMVNHHDQIYVESEGALRQHSARFTDDGAVRTVIERIVYPLGRRIDESSPMVDARLADGSRVNAVISPVALKGACLTIRKFPRQRLVLQDLVRLGSISEAMAQFLATCVAQRLNILISGGTGSGKTTLLNILGSQVPAKHRIVTIEDAAELKINHPHVVSLEARPKNMEGHGEITIRDLVRNALRMRPDRIVVGECRGAEAIDMLSAMNTGHDGSLTTLHANSTRDALSRLETMVLMAGKDLPLNAIRDQIVRAIQLIVQQTRLADGRRVITAIDEVTGMESGQIQLQPLMRYNRLTRAFQTQSLPPTFLAQWRADGFESPDWFNEPPTRAA